MTLLKVHAVARSGRFVVSATIGNSAYLAVSTHFRIQTHKIVLDSQISSILSSFFLISFSM